MKSYPFFILISLLSVKGFSQDEVATKILAEGRKLYRSEKASWHGTDVFLEKFSEKRPRIAGYISYTSGKSAVCIFFSEDDPGKVLGTITFDSTYNVGTALIDGVERDLTPFESDLVVIRMKALAEYKSDANLFKSYKDMNPNFIPLIDEFGKRVYILTGPQHQGVVVFGNDYLLTFDNNNNFLDKKQLHQNLISINSKGKDDVPIATMHTHLPGTGPYITPTDICTLMLYCPFTSWDEHYVISPKIVSIWDCEKGLATMTREAWDKIGKEK